MTLEARLILLAQAIGTDVKTLTTGQGTLASLSTSAQGNLVAAINEIHTEFDALLNDGSATSSTTEVWSANQITTYVAANASNAISAAADPAVGDDVASGFHVGQTWVNTTSDRTWVMVDGTTGAAIWSERNVINDASATSSLIDVWSANKITAVVEAAKTDVTSTILDSAPGALDTLNELAAALADDPDFASTMNTALGNRVRYDAAQSLSAPQKVQALTNIGAVATLDLGNFDYDFVAAYNTAKAQTMTLVDRLLALVGEVGVDIKSILTSLSGKVDQTELDSSQMDRTNIAIKESANLMKMHTTMLKFVTSTSTKL